MADHPALERLARLERGRPVTSRQSASRQSTTAMGYQPTLDGVRAISVIAVILYHAGFSWMHGGFFGVEVFFVVSGFLITSLLIEERDRDGRIDLRQFWVRRWRRLLPALFTMMIVVSVWAVFFGTSEQHSQLRRELPWGIGYVFNWGSILSQEVYFAGTPTLFRHLWSLAVEEQWYVVWPLVFVAVAARRAGNRRDDRRLGSSLAFVAFGVMAATGLMYLAEWPTRWFNPFTLQWQPVDTVNFLYLSTITRSSGLLLGAALGFLWRPWRIRSGQRAEAGRLLDLAASVAVVVLIASFIVGDLVAGTTYLALLPLVTLASAVLIAVVVHPWAGVARGVFSWGPLVALGKRSYGLYLWSWPISRILDAYEGSWSRFVLAMVITAVMSEGCYRYVETPIRKGAIGHWLHERHRPGWRLATACSAVSVTAVVASLGVFYSSTAKEFDPALDAGATEVAFDPAAATTTVATPDTGSEVSVGSSVPAVPITAARLPRRVVIVGDSTAHSLAINLPDGIEASFSIADGSVEGCSVYDTGTAQSARDGFTRSFGGCTGWEQKWVKTATDSGAEVALVVIGAWDVFDVEVDGVSIPFASQQGDARFIAGVQRGIDALTAAGLKVALLEVPCMRPQDVNGAGVPALPERGDDTRVAHLNDLLRSVAAENAGTTTFVAGPQQYCTDPAIAADLAYRWDGVHPYLPGAKLTFEAIAAALLSIPVP